MGSANAQRKGVWEPLPLIVYGYAVHPLSPSKRDTRLSSRRPMSTITEGSADESGVHRDVVSLEVGDEVYAFEKYTPRGNQADGIWYRGYVVCTARLPPVTWSTSSDPTSSSSAKPVKTEEPQQVFIGIFPASHIFVRDELSDAEGRLPDLVTSLTASISNHNGSVTSADYLAQWKRERANSGPEPPRDHRDRDREVRELTYDDERKSFKLGPPPDQAKSTRAALVVYPASIHSVPESENMKPLPPRPSLKSGDDTASGAMQPIIDEIASALREWHSMMFQYLARRDYKLFHTVREHIEALHLGRRQLLAQTLSAEETVSLRRDCVARLVSGNVVQDLDIIVRHPTWGALVTVDVEGEIDPRSWVSAVRMYAMQTSLAYINVPLDNSSKLTIGPSEFSTIPTPTLAHSAFPDISRHKTISRQVGSLGPHQPEKPTAAKFYHIFLDLRAFVATPCAPGETAELFFSVYKHSEFPRFVTEECCIVLNHNGVLSRDPNARIRSLFTDIAQSDAQDPLFLVCRIVRNGALKMNNTMGSGAPGDGGRRPSEVSLSDVPLTPSRTTLISDVPMNFRRPFGCAVLELSQLTKMMIDGTDVSPMKEYSMQIFVPTNEALFSMLHQDIIANNSKEFEKPPRAAMLAVSVKIFHGDSSTIIRENMSLLQGIPLTLRLGFPDVVFPGDVRNELYIKLWTGDFPSSPSGSARLSMVNFTRPGPVSQNAQVSIEVRDQEGRTIENAISLGSGEPNVTQFHSMVFMRNNQPTFGELIKLQLPLRGIPNWHLFFTFRNRSGRGLNADKPFAFAFQPLFPGQGAFLEDGSHTLVLYRADKLPQITPDMYLASSPWVLPGQRPEQVLVSPDLLRLASPMRDTVIIRSSLCSTKFTQNPVLMSLLNWEEINDKELLQTVLTKFTFVGEGEIVKFLRDIFDSLFGIMESQNNQAGEMDHLVFNALVTVLGIVQDRRFSNFQPVLDVYIEQHFNCAAASSHMIRSMDRLLRNPTGNDSASPLRAALKVWHYIFKFITRARELKKSTELGMGDGATAEHLEAMFKKEIRIHLTEVNKMMATTSPASIIGAQTIALQHFTSILPELAKIIPTIELVTVATNFVNAISTGKGKIIIWRLIMYLQIVKGFLFDNPNSRSLLVQAVVMWIKPHFGRYDEFTQTTTADSDSVRDAARVSWLESIRLCVTILAVMLDKLQLQLVSSSVMANRNLFRQEQENIEYILMLMPRLLDSYREFQNPANHRAVERTRTPTTTTAAVPITFPESYPFSLMALLPNAPRNATSTSLTHEDNLLFNPGLGETAIVLLSLVLSAPTKHIYNFLESSYDIEGKENFASLLTQFFKVATSILENDAFPSNWLNVNILTHKVLIKMMDPVATLLKRIFIPAPSASHQFKAELWKDAFFMLLKLLSSEQLVIEDFSPQKRRAVWRLGGDIRGEGADILLRLWEALAWPEPTESSSVSQGGYQAVLSSLIGYIVNLCLSHHDQLRNNAVGILFGMIISEYHQYGHFDQIETELVRKLDSLFMSQSKGDDISRVFFIAQLRHLFESSEVDDQLRERVSAFLDSVDAFLKLLLNVRRLPEGEEFADDRVIATLRLMNFIRDIGREEMYIKYVHQLVNAHLQSQNYVEAALTLKLHSDLHNWDLYSFVGPMEDLGLPQQSHFHRKETLCLLILDYLGKGKAYESAIEICKELAKQHAEVTFNYARLAEILRHQAALFEHIITDQRYYSDYFRVVFYGDFPDALRNKQFIYRGYEWEKFGTFCERLLNKHPGAQLLKSDPTVDQRFGNDQYVQCTAVTPEPDRTLPIFTSPDVPLAIRNYYEHSAINVFSSTKQITKFDRDGNEEIWLEKTSFTTEQAFPTVLRRSDITEWEVAEISPVENALHEVEQKSRELASFHLRYAALAKTAQVFSTNALSMSLNGAVDPPVDGLPAYREIFFDPAYSAKHPDRVEMIHRLRAAIDDQVRVTDSCLKLHGQICPQEMLRFHQTLEELFRKNFAEEIQRIAAENGFQHLPQSSAASVRAHDQNSLYDNHSHQRSLSISSGRPSFGFPLSVGGSSMSPQPISPLSSRPPVSYHHEGVKRTPLQVHAAHVARHGINGVLTSWRDTPSDANTGSPRDSLITVGNTGPGHSGASVTMSTIGSVNSIKGRLSSRFGSLTRNRRG
ncbi:uncharacterized protein F5891DRAFT_1126689 [Suillus fuscotomentosus]|uniref:Cytoplasmic protein n=1 Tax=Suillus fuscotomentosus TaxID=1912939 RepID=A0AAD4EE06_9AGAM|nr:uncharacterized protein F5891DRAFT_1126689 [Suillus fuscotomentosus]KAG1904321.1 hypothetical protein F5891DRAFT_1126689 [Suillus fuscotomentosus]